MRIYIRRSEVEERSVLARKHTIKHGELDTPPHTTAAITTGKAASVTGLGHQYLADILKM